MTDPCSSASDPPGPSPSVRDSSHDAAGTGASANVELESDLRRGRRPAMRKSADAGCVRNAEQSTPVFSSPRYQPHMPAVSHTLSSFTLSHVNSPWPPRVPPRLRLTPEWKSDMVAANRASLGQLTQPTHARASPSSEAKLDFAL